jgi:hypothetical protein
MEVETRSLQSGIRGPSQVRLSAEAAHGGRRERARPGDGGRRGAARAQEAQRGGRRRLSHLPSLQRGGGQTRRAGRLDGTRVYESVPLECGTRLEAERRDRRLDGVLTGAAGRGGAACRRGGGCRRRSLTHPRAAPRCTTEASDAMHDDIYIYIYIYIYMYIYIYIY